jgi:cupin superfamily acireductone dioxygenase involved in methionine salvage
MINNNNQTKPGYKMRKNEITELKKKTLEAGAQITLRKLDSKAQVQNTKATIISRLIDGSGYKTDKGIVLFKNTAWYETSKQTWIVL